jgi:Ca2+-binding EF-hand superfamily protein
MREVDRDGDGQMSFSEFTEVMMQVIKRRTSEKRVFKR